MQFTDCQRTDNHNYSLLDRTDRNVALTDCISASILDNPLSFIKWAGASYERRRT